jgi:hypothetical protein
LTTKLLLLEPSFRGIHQRKAPFFFLVLEEVERRRRLLLTALLLRSTATAAASAAALLLFRLHDPTAAKVSLVLHFSFSLVSLFVSVVFPSRGGPVGCSPKFVRLQKRRVNDRLDASFPVFFAVAFTARTPSVLVVSALRRHECHVFIYYFVFFFFFFF